MIIVFTDDQNVLVLLANVVAIERNPWFKTVTALADHVAGNRRGVTN